MSDDAIRILVNAAPAAGFQASDLVNGAIGIFGAILGSVATVIWTEFFNKRARDRDTKQRNAASSFAVFHKLTQIYSGTIAFRRHLKAGIELAKHEKADYKCLFLVPYASPSSMVDFTTDELWAMARVGGASLVNAVSALDQQHNAGLRAFETYGVQRTEIQGRLQPRAVEGQNANIEMDKAEFLKLAPQLAMLDDLIEQLLAQSETLISETFSAIESLVDAKEKPLGKEFEIELPNPQGSIVKLKS